MESKNEILQQEVDEFLCLSSEESEENDLSFWEFINPSDADSDVDHDIDELSLDSRLCLSWHSSLSSSDMTIPRKAQFDAVFDDVGVGYVEGVEEDVSYVGNQYCYGEYDDNEHDLGDGDDDLDDEYDGHDLDDELVPRSVSGKLGRQRMRKLGKRAFAKMYYSKKSPVLYMKPGAVHGKHGLGMKHSL